MYKVSKHELCNFQQDENKASPHYVDNAYIRELEYHGRWV